MTYLQKIYWRLPKSLREGLHPLVDYYKANTTYRISDGELAGFKLSGRDTWAYVANYEKNLVELLTRTVGEGDVCVDVGAHMGFMTLLFAKLVGGKGKVYAFEAYPANAKQVARNVQQNQMSDRVKVENMAISDGTADKLTIYAGRTNNSSEWNIVGHDVDGRPTQAMFEIPATSLDAYFANSAHVNLVKIDIEGAENLALRGMRRLLREQRPITVVEFHHEEGWQGREELLQANYRLFDSNSGQWIEEPLTHPRVYQCVAVPVEGVDAWAAKIGASGQG